MKTVWYYDITRNKHRYLRSALVPVILFLGLFILSVLMDRMCPSINRQYMRWPDMVKDLLGLPAWNSHLYVNLWQIAALFYPVYFIYDMMTGLAGSIIQEERLETIVYLHNLSIRRRTVLWAKAAIWMIYTLFCMLLLSVENLLFFRFLQSDHMIITMGKYYAGLYLVSLFYMTIALFIASYEKQESRSYDTVLAVIILPLLLARIYALVKFFADLMITTGRGGSITGKLSQIAGKLKVLEILSPVTWSWPGIDVSHMYIGCGILIGVVMLVAADCIYNYRNIINME